eukprot:TRINITY_DN350_c0_g1_i1.p1 TRINITY_DN350_c0_g1~~TRINITY_DN350_c0_g1_i1.p1  ORF type:complete len:308 (-),score=81.41 TRINITY_DN350_c0_g1_i1:94-1017(-)
MRTIFAVFIIALFVGDVAARCGTVQKPAVAKAAISDRLSARRASKGAARQDYDPIGRTVHVYWHVVTDGSGDDVVTKEQAQANLDILNDAYEPVGLKFELFKYEVVKNSAWTNLDQGTYAEAEMKQELHYGTAADFNIYCTRLYVGSQGGLLGWATWPDDYEATPYMDGVVIDFQTVPGVVDGYVYGLGDTLTHEAGHWFGLYHTFEGGCIVPGDEVDDTPYEAEPQYDCPSTTVDTCSQEGTDPFHNFMDYSPDACMYEFSDGQFERISLVWGVYRDVDPAEETPGSGASFVAVSIGALALVALAF